MKIDMSLLPSGIDIYVKEIIRPNLLCLISSCCVHALTDQPFSIAHRWIAVAAVGFWRSDIWMVLLLQVGYPQKWIISLEMI